jgi:hypothetical protein
MKHKTEALVEKLLNVRSDSTSATSLQGSSGLSSSGICMKIVDVFVIPATGCSWHVTGNGVSSRSV